MKKYMIISVTSFVIGAIIFFSIGVYATLTYNASQITYTKNNIEMPLSNAIDELYTSANEPSINKINGTVTSTYLISKDTSTDDDLTLSLGQGNFYVFVSMSRGYPVSSATDTAEGYHNYEGSGHFTYTNGNCIFQDGNTIYSIGSTASNSRYAMINARSLVYKCQMNQNGTVSFNSKATVSTASTQVYSIYALKI